MDNYSDASKRSALLHTAMVWLTGGSFDSSRNNNTNTTSYAFITGERSSSSFQERSFLSTEDDSGPVDISPLRLILSTLPLPLLAFVSMHLQLGLHRKLAVAVVRCAAQLSVLGYILLPIFITNQWWLTAIYTFCMLLVASAEAVSRPSHSYSGMLPQVLGAIGVAGAGAIMFGLAAVVQVDPWYDAQYLIPMLGMLLGNACSSVAVGLSAVLEELSTGKDKVEALLALGATRVEATREVVQRATQLALTPLLNSMNVVGIVSIPGMMTGQILGGSDPAVASRYQIVIYYLVAISSSVSAIATIYAAVLTICDDKHRLRAEKLRPAQRTSGGVSWMRNQLKQGWLNVCRCAMQGVGRVRRALQPHPASRERHRYFTYRRSESGGGEIGDGRNIDVEQPLLPQTHS